MKITNIRVYGLHESIIASGYPMSDAAIVADMDSFKVEPWGNMAEMTLLKKDYPDARDLPGFDRACKLGNAKAGSGHDCFLKGITVQADIQAPCYWWPEWQRYHFQDIVSSQSKMHRIGLMLLEEHCNEFVRADALMIAVQELDRYNGNPTDENFERVLANTPQGLELTARVTFNYLQAKSMYSQRKSHRLKMWKAIVIPEIANLPYAKELGVLS